MFFQYQLWNLPPLTLFFSIICISIFYFLPAVNSLYVFITIQCLLQIVSLPSYSCKSQISWNFVFFAVYQRKSVYWEKTSSYYICWQKHHFYLYTRKLIFWLKRCFKNIIWSTLIFTLVLSSFKMVPRLLCPIRLMK